MSKEQYKYLNYLKGSVIMADMGTKQAAEMWGVKQSTVSRWCRNNMIKGATQDKKNSPWHIPVNAIPPTKKK